MITLFAFANAFGHVQIAQGEGSGVGVRLGLALVIMLIALIGGRIVPSFTRNWMAKRAMAPLPAAFSGFDKACLAVTGLALLAWVAAPAASFSEAVLGLAGALNLVRLLRWQGWRTWREPLVTILHVGYLWVALGLFLLGFAELLPGLPSSAAVHALGAGAVGTMTLAVMTRASLGHTGRALTAGPGTVTIYLLVVLGALLRVLSPLLPVDATVSLGVSAALWGGAFLLFVAVYGPMLCRPRAKDA